MPRRREVPKREILPDPKFGSVDVAKFANVIMLAGKKAVAERIIYGAFDTISAKGGKDPLEVFATRDRQRQAARRGEIPVASVVPTTRCRSSLPPVRRMALSMRWLARSCEQAQREFHATPWPRRRADGSGLMFAAVR